MSGEPRRYEWFKVGDINGFFGLMFDNVTVLSFLAGILVFFMLEKVVLLRHCHANHCPTHGAAAPLVILGDAFHNFIDGAIIAAAVLTSVPLGVKTAIAVAAHEVPQEVGDFLILLDSGYSKARALALNALSSLASVAGALLGYFALSAATEWVPRILAIAAAGMLYVAVADLIPGLHRRTRLAETAQQFAFIALGIATVWVSGGVTKPRYVDLRIASVLELPRHVFRNARWQMPGARN